MPSAPEAALRLGVVGGGLIAQLAHLPALRDLDDLFHVRALAEPSAHVRDTLARRHGIAATYPDHQELLERERLDAVLVCSPNGTHAQVTLDALDAGLHVLVEKPLCLAPSAAAAIVSRARDARRVVQVGYMKRFDPAYEELLERRASAGTPLLADTRTVDPGIGERLRPRGFAGGRDVPDAAVRALTASTGLQVAEALGSDDPRHVRPFSEAFLGALIHDVNLVLGIRDVDWRVTDAASADDGTIAYGAWKDADGVRWTAAWMLLASAREFGEELTLTGSDGVLGLHFPAPYHVTAPTALTVNGVGSSRRRPAVNAYVRELEHFHACVTEGAECRTPAAQGARDVELLTELYRAAVAA